VRYLEMDETKPAPVETTASGTCEEGLDGTPRFSLFIWSPNIFIIK